MAGEGPDRKLRVVVIGAGFGGLKAVKSLADLPLDITLIDRRNHHLFQPLLYQIATASLAPSMIATPIRSIFSRQKNVRVLMAEVSAIDRAAREVVADDLRVPYDVLVVATGARHSYFGHGEWESNAPGLKSIEDATRIRAHLLRAFEKAEVTEDPAHKQALMTFIVVGGGPTGVEMAGAIAEVSHHVLAEDFRNIDPRSARVMLVEAGPRILAAFPPELSERAKEDLERLNVEVKLSLAVKDIRPNGVVLGAGAPPPSSTSVPATPSGESLAPPADVFVAAGTVLWAAGVQASPAGQWLSAATDRAGRVIVGKDLTLPGHPEIFVIGDTASVAGADGRPLPGVAPVAIQQGKFVAGVIAGRARGEAEAAEFRYFDKGNLATIGRASAVASFGRWRMTGFLAWLLWCFVHILYLIGFRNRIAVVWEWFWAYLRWRRGARLITGGPELDD